MNMQERFAAMRKDGIGLTLLQERAIEAIVKEAQAESRLEAAKVSRIWP